MKCKENKPLMFLYESTNNGYNKTNSIKDHIFKLHKRFLGYPIWHDNLNLIKQIIVR